MLNHNNTMKYNRRISKSIIAVTAAGLLPFAAFADHHKNKSGDAEHKHDAKADASYKADESKAYDRDAPSRNTYGKDDRKMNKDYRSAEPKAVRFEQLDGRDVVGEDGESLGTVTDAVVNLDSGEIDSYILSTGLWGIGNEYRVKADRFSGMLDESGKERANLTKSDRNDMEDFDESSLQDTKKFGMLSNIVGQDVEGEDGAFAGSVEDVLIDPKRGNVPYVIVRQAPSPLGSFRYDYFAVRTNEIKGMKDGELKLAIKDGKLASAPMLGSETDLKWKDGEEVYRYNTNR